MVVITGERILFRVWPNGLPIWQIALVALWAIAVIISWVLEPGADGQPRPLRPLLLVTIPLAVVITTLVALSDTASDRWLLLAWCVPVGLWAGESWLVQRTAINVDHLVIYGAVVLAVATASWLAWDWRSIRIEESFTNRVSALVCSVPTVDPTTDLAGYLAANRQLAVGLRALKAPDASRQLRLNIWANALLQAEAARARGDTAELAEWEAIAAGPREAFHLHPCQQPTSVWK